MSRQVSGIIKTIENIIPGSHADILDKKEMEKINFDQWHFKKGLGGSKVGIINGKEKIIWLEILDKRMAIKIERNLPLTKAEVMILLKIPESLAGLTVVTENKALKFIQNISSHISFEHILVAKFLREVDKRRFYPQSLILSTLQQLTYERYEGDYCTSGFIYTSKPERYIQYLESNVEYELIKFNDSVYLTEEFFDMPNSFRYVDGKNSFYLVDNWQKIHGVIKSKNPKNFSILDRCALKHVESLVNFAHGRVFAAFNGINNDVQILTRKAVNLSWNKNHWHLKDKSILEKIMREFQCDENFIEHLTSIIYCLSELRKGCLILIPVDNSKLPEFQGNIDNSKIGKLLLESVLNLSINDLNLSNSAINIMSSDGLTIFDKEGRVRGFGNIIKLDGKSNVSGGGRSQAALIASDYGLAIKISEDGPITIYKNREEIITI